MSHAPFLKMLVKVLEENRRAEEDIRKRTAHLDFPEDAYTDDDMYFQAFKLAFESMLRAYGYRTPEDWKASKSAAPRGGRGGRHPKPEKNLVPFGMTVLAAIPRFELGKRLASSGATKLREKKFSDLEIKCIMESRKGRTAAIRWASKKFNIGFETGSNYFSTFTSPHPRERH